MRGTTKILVSGQGVVGEVLPLSDKEKKSKSRLQKLKVKFTIDENALPGVRDFRLATPAGASTLGQLVIVRDKVIFESKSNNTSAQAQSVSLPATICGKIEKAEDVDFFKFKAKKEELFSFHVRSMRLQNKIHDLQQHSDPILTLRTSAGVTIAASDNFFFGDPFISHKFENDGEYLLEIRDVRYQGNAYWQYSIEVNSRPFVTNIFPFGLPPGKENKVELIGFGLKENRAKFSLPMSARPGATKFEIGKGNLQTNPFPIIVSKLDLVTESERDALSSTVSTAEESSNDQTSEKSSKNKSDNALDSAQLVSLPVGINGRISSEKQIDIFSFDAKKGEKYSFEVLARRYGSSLDSHLRILNASGKQLSLNDDLRIGIRNHSDSRIENWTVPADGKYFVEVRDLHLRGGPSFVYFLKVTKAEPHFEIFVDTDKTQLTPGTNGVIFVRAVRKNGFDGEIQLEINDLPDGVTSHNGRILAGKSSDGCIVLSASKDAKPNIKNAQISGVAKLKLKDGKLKKVSAIAKPYQETYQPGGGRAQFPVEMHTVSVSAPGDILKVDLSSNEITLKPGESKTIDVTISRAKGFKGNIQLDVLYQHLSTVFANALPQGVTLDASSSKTLLTKGATAGKVTLKAAKNAPQVEKQQIVIMANVSLNFVMKATYASDPILVSVAK